MGLKLVIQDDNGTVLGMVDATSRGKTKPFSSGSAGYYVNGKISLPSVIDGEKPDAPNKLQPGGDWDEGEVPAGKVEVVATTPTPATAGAGAGSASRCSAGTGISVRVA